MQSFPKFYTIAGMSKEYFECYKQRFFEVHKNRIIKIMGDQMYIELKENTFSKEIQSQMKYESPLKMQMPASIRFSITNFNVPKDFMIPTNALLKSDLRKIGIFRLIGNCHESNRVKDHMCRMIKDNYSPNLVQQYIFLSLLPVDIAYMMSCIIETYEGALIPSKHLLALLAIEEKKLVFDDFLFAIKTILLDLSESQIAMIEAISAVFVRVSEINTRRINAEKTCMGIKELSDALFLRFAPIDPQIMGLSVPKQQALTRIFSDMFENYETILKVDENTE